MQTIDDIATLEALYEGANPLSISKVAGRLTPLYRQWIGAARFVVVTTVGPEGTDGSPRGDIGPVVRIMDDGTLWLPDWRGNNRLDSLRNILRDGRISLMFMVPGSSGVVRVNGRAVLTADRQVTDSFARKGITPRSVIVVTIAEVYFQCAKAIMRSELWSGEDHSAAVPSAGDFLREAKAGFDGEAYDAAYADRAPGQFW